MVTSPGAGTGGGRARPAAVAIVAFLTTIDGTIVNVALPSIQRDLRMSLASAQWVVTVYLIAFSALMLTGGRLTDRYGQGAMLRLGLAVFTAASLLAGVARCAAVLLLARAVQGCGAALALPSGLAMAASGPTARDRDAVAAVWMASLAAALASGPVIGGWISQHLGWHWIFLVNLPAGLVGLTVAGFVPRDARARLDHARLDWAGLVCSAVALAAATFVLTEGATAGWASPRILTAGAVALGSAAGRWRAERRRGAPMIDQAMLTGGVIGGVAVSVLWGSGVNGAFFCTSIYLQRDAGFSPTMTGLVFVPAAALVVLVTPFVPAMTVRLGAGRTVACGLLVVSAGLALLTVAASPHIRVGMLVGPSAVIGAGSALTVPLTTSVLASVPRDSTGVAGGILSLAREISGLAGICVITLIVTVSGGGPRGADLPARGYPWGILAAAALTAVGALIAWRTLPGRDAPKAP
jgi:EmrB/QacA subfamily drug resistance transporter